MKNRSAPTRWRPRPASRCSTRIEQDGIRYYTLRDLRYHKLIHNVTKATDRRLWRAAIAQREKGDLDEAAVRWKGDYGLWRSYRQRSGDRRYDLVYRGDGDPRIFFGVSEVGNGRPLEDAPARRQGRPPDARAPGTASDDRARQPSAGQIRIGISSWGGLPGFYPSSIKSGDKLAWFARFFSVVEVNVSFYRIVPPAHLCRTGPSMTPADFMFDVKAFQRADALPRSAAGRDLRRVSRIVCSRCET